MTAAEPSAAMPARLRLARSSDRQALVDLLHATWRTTFAPHLPGTATTTFFERKIAETYIARDWPGIVVAEIDGVVTGLAHLENRLIATLHVAPDLWGRGIGRQLLQHVEHEAVLHGHRAVALQVEDFNARAIELYRRSGYLEIARRPDREFGSGGRSITMAKLLDVAPGVVRAWRPDDRTRCHTLFDGNVPAYFADRERADFVAFLGDLHGLYLVIEDVAGDVVACGGLQADDHDDSIAVLCWGMVDRQRHRVGLGRRLLQARLDLIAASGLFKTVTIETTPFSRGFFERAGFVCMQVVSDGFAPGYDRVDMQRPIGAVR
jgi:ribosomal protein S18 acetylase RimI-like enzyme